MASKKWEKQINDLIADLEALPKVIKKGIISAGPDIEKELEETHSRGKNPYKERWTKRKAPVPSWDILNRTGHIMSSYSAEGKGRGKLQVTNRAETAEKHHKGKGNVPQRLLIPTKNKDIPKHWLKIIEKRVKETIKKER